MFAQRTFVIMPHERRVLVTGSSFVSAAGLRGPGAGWRERMGLPGGGPDKVITDSRRSWASTAAQKRMRLESVHPGVTVDEVVAAATGFELLVPAGVGPDAAAVPPRSWPPSGTGSTPAASC